MNKSITITIQLLAHYRVNRFKVEQRVYSSGITVKDIIDELGINEYKFPLGILMVNSKHEKEEYVLQEGDVLILSPKLGGG